MIQIDIKPASMEHQVIKTVEYYYLILSDDYLRWSCRFIADEPKDMSDPLKGWHEVKNIWEVVIKKEHITSVELGIHASGKRWYVGIIGAFRDDIFIYFKEEMKARELFSKVFQYLFGKL